MAAMKAVDPRVTHAELEQWPDDGRRYELYGGEVIVVPTPLPVHQLVVLRLTQILSEYARITGGLALFAPLDIVFSEYDVLQPDVVFFNAERHRQIDFQRPIRIVPSLVVEVLLEAPLSATAVANARSLRATVCRNTGSLIRPLVLWRSFDTPAVTSNWRRCTRASETLRRRPFRGCLFSSQV